MGKSLLLAAFSQLPPSPAPVIMVHALLKRPRLRTLRIGLPAELEIGGESSSRVCAPSRLFYSISIVFFDT